MTRRRRNGDEIMTPEEAGIIRDIFDRIRHMGPAPRDPEARAAVEHELRANPDALIGLVRAIVALDRERAALIEENEALRAALEGPAQPSSGGGLFGDGPGYGQPGPAGGHPGGWSPGPAPQQQREPWGSAPWGRSRPMPETAPPTPGPGGPWGSPAGGQQGGGVMRTALGAAAGLAGGMFAYDAVKGMLGGANQDGKSGTAQAAESGGQASGTDDFVTGGGTEESGGLFDLFGDVDDL